MNGIVWCSNTYEGPLDDQVYCIPGILSNNEYSVSIMSGETYAPTPTEGPVYN